jgi:hypothetical protein
MSESNLRSSQSIGKNKLFDVSGDGKVDIVDIAAVVLISLFSFLVMATLAIFGRHLYQVCDDKERVSSMISYAIPLSHITGTLASLVYAMSFMDTTSKSKFTKLRIAFFDFDKDGQVGMVDRLCCFTGIAHSIVIVVDIVLWLTGSLGTREVVEFVSSLTRVIVLFLTKSYSSHVEDPRRQSGWRFLLDFNHDGEFQLADGLAMVCMVTYTFAAAYAWQSLVFPPFAESDVNLLIQLSSQLNFVLVSGFAAVYLAPRRPSAETSATKALCVFAVFYLVLLFRTIAEMYFEENAFEVMARLANGIAVGVTQLVMGAYVIRSHGPSSASPAGASKAYILTLLFCSLTLILIHRCAMTYFFQLFFWSTGMQLDTHRHLYNFGIYVIMHSHANNKQVASQASNH